MTLGHPESVVYSTRCGRTVKEKTKCLASCVKKLCRGSQNLKNRSRDPDHGSLGGHSSTIR